MARQDYVWDANFGTRVQLWMERRRLGTGDVARLVGVSDGAVSKWRSGGKITLPNLTKLAEALGVSVSRLMPADLSEEDMERERIELDLIRSTDAGGPLLDILAELGLDEALRVLKRAQSRRTPPVK